MRLKELEQELGGDCKIDCALGVIFPSYFICKLEELERNSNENFNYLVDGDKIRIEGSPFEYANIIRAPDLVTDRVLDKLTEVFSCPVKVDRNFNNINVVVDTHSCFPFVYDFNIRDRPIEQSIDLLVKQYLDEKTDLKCDFVLNEENDFTSEILKLLKPIFKEIRISNDFIEIGTYSYLLSEENKKLGPMKTARQFIYLYLRFIDMDVKAAKAVSEMLIL